METRTIHPSPVRGSIQAPASKSVAVRAVVAALLSDGTSVLSGYTPCVDAEYAVRAIEALGAKVQRGLRTLSITGNIPHKPQSELLQLSCGESGLLSRLLASVGLLYSSDLELIGEGTLLNRPLTVSSNYFEQLGLQHIPSKEPSILHLRGQLKASQQYIDGSGGSQLLSGLLMALPLLQNDSELIVENLKSKPYIDLTISTLKSFGIEIESEVYSQYFVRGNQQYQANNYTIEGDWSGASCLLVAGAVGGSITVSGLAVQSLQADCAIIKILHACGAEIEMNANSITVSRDKLKPFEFDATHCPDLFPALVALASSCEGVSRIEGVSRLKHKESDRATVLQQEFAKLQVPIAINGDTMEVTGGSIQGGEVFAHNDHRIAMALAVAGLNAKGAVKISGVESVDKSYPNFFEDIHSITRK